ncbi:MAG: endonuclease III [Candidatus Nanoarchaeia archaeon]
MEETFKNKDINWTKNLNPFQILIGAVLSTRTKDINTEKATKLLFQTYSSPKSLAKAPLSKVKKLIRSAGFYKTKAKQIKEISKILLNKYNEKIPKSREELEKLPGVGKKVSAIVLSFAFNSLDVIPVDVHVFRIANRIGLVKTKTPEETEKELLKIVPKEFRRDFNKLFVLFGQNICSKNPKCKICPIRTKCTYFKKIYKLNFRK